MNNDEANTKSRYNALVLYGTIFFFGLVIYAVLWK